MISYYTQKDGTTTQAMGWDDWNKVDVLVMVPSYKAIVDVDGVIIFQAGGLRQDTALLVARAKAYSINDRAAA